MPEQQATAGAHSRIIQVFGNGNVLGGQPYLSQRVPFRNTCAVPGAPGNEAALLGPGAGVTTFVGREQIITSFETWATSHVPERPVSVRVVHGGAGVGKTRFAMELCWALGQEWQAGFVDGIEARRFFRQTNLADWGWQKPVLVVFDYAITLLDVLPDWMRELCAIPESPHPLRIVLLERQAGQEQGGWLERAFPGDFGIQPVCPRDLLDGEPWLLPGMADFAMQRGIMQDMLRRLGSSLVLPTDDAAFRDRLARTDWAGAPLYLMMAAMVMHRQGGMGDMLHLGRVDLAHAVADHELERLRRACQRADAGRAALELFLPHMAAVSSLCGGLPEEIVSDCVRRGKAALGCESVDTAVALQRLRDLLPDERRAGIAPIRPDIVGEAFMLAQLGNGQANEGKRAVLRAFADRPSEVAAVLVRCIQDFAPRGADAASVRENQDQERAMDWLRAVGDARDLPLPLRFVILDAIPQQTLALRMLAVDWQRRAVTRLREQAVDSHDLRAELARNLNNFCVRLSEAGQRKEALKIAGEAVELYRALAEATPDAFRPALATSLNNLAKFFSEQGKRQEALTTAREAAERYRPLAEVNPGAFRPNLATSLNNLTEFLSELGKWQEALTTAQEAIDICRQLAEANPDAFRPALGMGLNNLASRLSETGQREEALTIAQEAVELYRALAGANPDAFRPDLAGSLNNLTKFLSEQGKRQEALTTAQEAAELYRALAEANPDAFRPGLARSLNNLANCLSALEKRQEALTTAQEAAELYRELAAANQDAFRPDLARSLNNLANCLSDAGQRQEALTTAQEAAELYRELAAANQDTFRADLAGSLNNLASRLSEMGKRQEALITAQEAVDIRRQLAKDNPDAFRPDLARSLNNFANRLSGMGKRQEALTTAREAAELYRALAEANPDAFRPGLARSLNNLANRLSDAGRRQEALAAAQEAVDIRRPLAEANPDAFRPGLARSLNNLANSLSELGQYQGALATARESAQLFVLLCNTLPEAFRQDCMVAMTTWLSLRHGVSHEEASSLFQQDPDAHIRSLFEDGGDDTDTPAP